MVSAVTPFSVHSHPHRFNNQALGKQQDEPPDIAKKKKKCTPTNFNSYSGEEGMEGRDRSESLGEKSCENSESLVREHNYNDIS